MGEGTSPPRMISSRRTSGWPGQRGREQRLGVGIPGLLEQGLHLRVLEDPPEVHHRQPVRHVPGGAEVVRHQQIRHAVLLLEVLQQIHDLRADGDVEGRDGFVQDQQLWLGDQRARDRDALALATAELVRVVPGLFGLQAHVEQHLRDPLLHLAPRQVMVDPQRFRHDVLHPHARVERAPRILKDRLHPRPISLERRTLQLVDVLAFEEHLPFGRCLEPKHEPCGRGLAAARFADEGQGLALGDGQIDSVHRVHLSDLPGQQQALGDREVLLYPFEPQDFGVCHAGSSSFQQLATWSPSAESATVKAGG